MPKHEAELFGFEGGEGGLHGGNIGCHEGLRGRELEGGQGAEDLGGREGQ